LIAGKQANPVLFDRAVFPALRNINGDASGRQRFSGYPIQLINWDDPLLLLDIDTPKDYQKLYSNFEPGG